MKECFLILVLCCLAGGCSMMPSYERPPSPVAALWPEHGEDPVLVITRKRNRRFFNDARLRALIETAIKNNRDLRLAALNVDLLGAQYRVGTASGIPNIVGESDGQRQRSITTTTGVARTTGLYTLKAGVTSYELDLFGRVRSLRAQALENYLASQETKRSVQITLIAQVATQYLNQQSLGEQLKQGRAILKSAREYAALIKRSEEIGNASALDVRLAQAQVETLRAAVASGERQLAQAQNALVLLVGGPLPDDLPEGEDFYSRRVLGEIPSSLPSDVIAHRPDILAAEHQLKGANANIGAARAAFFPKILLTASGGIASVSLKDLFTGTSVWNFAPQITVPIFDAGANKAGLDAAKILKSVEVAQYEKTIQTAFREVADALTARGPLNDQFDAQQALVKTRRERDELAQARYRQGVESYLFVLSAQEDLYTAQQTLAQAQLQRLLNAIDIYKALGGGWEEYSLSP